MCVSAIEKHGATPANIQWTVVRGDSANLKIEFFEDDEITAYDTDNWSYVATAYDISGDVLDNLPVAFGDGYAEIQIPASITENWGSEYKNIVAELPFDLEVTIADAGEDTVWTPVIGTICVIGDITPGGSL
jgi:hypothetical protein